MIWMKTRGPAFALGLHVASLLVTPLHAAEPAAPARAAQPCEKSAATIAALQGEVRYRALGQAWQAATLDQALCAGVELQVSPGGRAVLRLNNGSTIPLDQNTHIILRGLASDGLAVQMELVSGNINVATSGAAPIQLITPHGRVDTKGGDFAVKVTPQKSALSVFEGDVAVSSSGGNVLLHSDETAYFAQVAAPSRDITVKPRDLVQWVLQYPAIIQAQDAKGTPWAAAASALEQGHLLDALISLDQVPSAARSAEYFVFRANLLLLAGEADEARTNLDTALQLNPSLADAWALRAILDLGKNDTAQALQYAEKAIQTGPQSAAAHLAHSYALQADRQTEAALASARHVVELAPERALGYTRLAELELARGDSAAALQAAQRAEQINPKSVDAKAMLGFVYLSQVKLKDARAAFESAVQLNSADPRARMGLGLTRIRQGQLQSGREDLELAASLDPENPLLRTYLGRAYQEEGRNSEAAEQYARAKRLDPKDPTAFYFAALQLAEENRPVSAREALQEALSRNENRAVYRGKALLQQDEAQRTANEIGLNRVLGLDDTARVRASESLARAPNEAVLHRALGDALATLPRSQPTRESEYLQALLRDPLGALPTPLFLAESARSSTSVAPQHGFFQAAGAVQTGYNEFGAAFNQSQIRAQLDGIVAGQSSRGDQLLLSGVAGNVGVSISQLHFKTDGFGDYNRLDNTIWQGAIQAELDTGTRLYAERRHFDSERIEILNQAEPFIFLPLQIDEQRQRSRFGVRQRIGDSHELLFLNSWDDTKQNALILPTPFLSFLLTEPVLFNNLSQKAVTREAQYVFHTSGFSLFLGSVKTNLDVNEIFADASINQVQTQSRTAYLYTSYSVFPQLRLEAAVSRDQQEMSSGFRQTFTNPKFGLRWEVLPGATLRLAKFNVVNRALISSASLEPTQVAGFNQFFSDGAGFLIRARNKGVGWDQNLVHGFSYGFESQQRDLDVPIGGGTNDEFFERNRRAYLNWAVPPSFQQTTFPGLESTLSLVYDEQDYRRDGFTGAEEFRDYKPRHLRLGANFNHANRFGINLAATQVSLRGEFPNVADQDFNQISLPFRDRFWTFDVALTYRLPKQVGQLIVGALNITNRRGFQYLEIDPLNPRFAPERYVYAKFVVSF